jgi:transcriptional regulator with PAS, ATPase and Fis domain
MTTTYETFLIDEKNAHDSNHYSFIQQRNYDELTTSIINDLFKDSAEAILGVDSHGIIRICNTQCEKLLKASRHLMYGMHYSYIFCSKNNACKSNDCRQCPISKSINNEELISNKNMTLQRSNSEKIDINIGSYFIYQENENDACTFFSFK